MMVCASCGFVVIIDVVVAGWIPKMMKHSLMIHDHQLMSFNDSPLHLNEIAALFQLTPRGETSVRLRHFSFA